MNYKKTYFEKNGFPILTKYPKEYDGDKFKEDRYGTNLLKIHKMRKNVSLFFIIIGWAIPLFPLDGMNGYEIFHNFHSICYVILSVTIGVLGIRLWIKTVCDSDNFNMYGGGAFY